MLLEINSRKGKKAANSKLRFKQLIPLHSAAKKVLGRSFDSITFINNDFIIFKSSST